MHTGRFAILRTSSSSYAPAWTAEGVASVNIVGALPENCGAFFAAQPTGSEVETHASYEIIPPLLHYYSYSDQGNKETNLWGPFLWQRDRTGGVFNVMPFFWHSWGKNEEHITLFPFFHYGWEGTSHLLVTPLFVEAKGLDGSRTFVSPLYARYRGRTELDMVTPLFWWYRDPDIGLDLKMLLPFFYKSDSPTAHDTVVFPFYANFWMPGISNDTWITPLFEWKRSRRSAGLRS